ncbi:MAG: carboxypeptidase-like regulatory domain-containing protein [Bacillota bacterium]
MSELKKTGEGPENKAINFWGRVRDPRGNYVEGALVMLTTSSGGKEVCLGHTYSSSQGFYLISIDREGRELADGAVRVMAGMGGQSREGAAKGNVCHRFYPRSGKKPPAIECQIINYHLLKAISPGSRSRISVEAVPETVKVSFFLEALSGVKVCHIKGRGYIQSESDQGEGLFSITVCTIGEGLNEQEMVRMKTVPEERYRKSLFFDSGSLMTDIFF